MNIRGNIGVAADKAMLSIDADAVLVTVVIDTILYVPASV